MTRSLVAAIAAAALLIAALAIWSLPDRGTGPAGGKPDSESASAPSRPIGPLPAPGGRTVLTITGVARGNVGARTTKVDLATLERRLPQHQVAIHEPFIKKDVSFTGVRMSDLLRAAGVATSAGTVYMHALDDYTVNLPIAGVAADGLLATRADGKRIPVAEGGPIRLVFTEGSELGSNPDNWIWSIDSMRPSR